MLSKAWKWASISVGAPLLGNMDGHFFFRAFLLLTYLLTYLLTPWSRVILEKLTGPQLDKKFSAF